MIAAPKSVATFLEEMGLDRVDIIGNSMGGMVGAMFAIAQPERVR